MYNCKTIKQFKWFIIWWVLVITISLKSFLRFDKSNFICKDCTFVTSISLCLPWSSWELVICDTFSRRLLMIQILFSFSVFKFSTSFASLCFPEFKHIFEIFLFKFETFPITKFFNVKNSARNELIVIFPELSCSFAFWLDVSPSFP